MWLVLGLGNPGPEYRSTRHNVGFAVVEELARRHGVELSKRRHQALFGRGSVRSAEVLLAEPQTYMNLSGDAARALMAFHQVDLGHLIVVHDEADFAAGVVKLKRGGGAGGHNGISSIVDHLGSGEFLRLRVGIGRPERGGAEMARHVLSRPVASEAAALRDAVERATDALEEVLADGPDKAMNRINRREPPSQPS
jgi:PTH1 family peptidyl-tRNA hydrolase